jgi:hypothetical protein
MKDGTSRPEEANVSENSLPTQMWAKSRRFRVARPTPSVRIPLESAVPPARSPTAKAGQPRCPGSSDSTVSGRTG